MSKYFQEFHVKAVDGDVNVSSPIEYELDGLNGILKDNITIDNDGKIVVTSIDRESLEEDFVKFKVKAIEKDDVGMQTESDITFIIQDINDNRPMITISHFERRIPENVNWMLLDKIEIEDKDLGEFGTYKVEFINNNPGRMTPNYSEAFQIIPSQGYQKWSFSISVLYPTLLDYEDEAWQEFTIQLEAADSEGSGNTCNINVELENRNDEIPVFEQDNYIFEKLEDIKQGTSIGAVHAIDRDINDTVQYTLIGSSWAGTLDIDSDTGLITTMKDNAFDYEKQKEVLIQVQAEDTLKDYNTDVIHKVYTQVTIMVQDVNDEPPKILLSGDTPEVLENIEAGKYITNIAHITANDEDTDAELEFKIDWTASWATKQGTKVAEKLYKDCLEIETEYEDLSKKGKAYGMLRVQSIEVDSETITIDYEKYDFLYLKIEVTDINQTYPPGLDAATLTIAILDENDNPPRFDMTTINSEKTVVETAKSNFYIGAIVATDIDGPNNNKIEYLLKPTGNTPAKLVKINSANGQLHVDANEAIDADTNTMYNLTYIVTARDKDHNTEEEIIIQIIDTNNKFPELKTNVENTQVWENETRKYLLTIDGFDRDRDLLYHTIAYSINTVTDPQLPVLFTVDRQTGQFFLDVKEGKLERDGPNGHTSYLLNVILRDNNGTGIVNTNDTISFEVVIKDYNDNAPILQDLEIKSIAENTEKDTEVAKIIAIDIDEEDTDNSRIQYEVGEIYRLEDDGTGEEPTTGLFVIDGTTGSLRTGKSLKGYFGDIIVNIKTHDFGDPEQRHTKNYTISVTKYNFEEPKFVFPEDGRTIVLLKAQSNINKLVTINGDYLQKIEASDQQKNKYNIKFRIIKTGNDETFKIGNQYLGQNTGELQLNSPHEDNDPYKYQLTIEAFHDGVGKASNVTQIQIEVQFIDPDEEPFFDYVNGTQLKYSMLENSTAETIQIEPAIDLKQQDIFYYLYKTDNDNFEINQTTGEIGLLKELDREEIDFHDIKIISTNSKSGVPEKATNPKSLLDIRITVIDINDNPPRFNKSIFSGSMSVSDDPDRQILQLKAEDPDTVDEGKLVFRMLPESIKVTDNSLNGVKDKAFKTNSDGTIKSLFRPQETMQGLFEFTVEVEDTPPAKHTAQAIVKIFIISESIRIPFKFKNTKPTINDNQDYIAQVFSQIIGYDCSIDDIHPATDSSGVALANETEIKTIFVNNKDEPINKDIIIRKASDVDNVYKLRSLFAKNNLYFSDLPKDDDPITNLTETLNIILIAVSSVLGIMCVVLLVSCIIRTRSLNRRLDAMNVPAFGSHMSGLNRMGVSAPGTNKHAIEANPVWNEDLKSPQFDNISQGSGGSDLIGIEDNPEFQYAADDQRATFNPVFSDEINKKSLNPLAAGQSNAESISDDDDIFS